MEVHHSARKHGVSDADIQHALDHRLHVTEVSDDEPPWRVLYLGPDRSGNLLEIVTLERDDGTELVIHAMKMRKSYESLLRPLGGMDHE